MKKSISLVALSFVTLFFTSCAVRTGLYSASETFTSSSGSVAVAPQVSKSASQAKVSATSTNSSSSVLNISNTTSKTGFFVGIYFTDIEIADKLELQPEVDLVIVSDFNQIQVPVLAKYNVADKFNVLAGPNISYLLDASDGIKSLNFSLDFGAAYDFAEKFNVNARYGVGLTNILENPGGSKSKLSGFQVGVGYKF